MGHVSRIVIACSLFLFLAGPVAPAQAQEPWYRAGGVPASAVAGAYQAMGAASFNDSRSNLNDPGVNDLVVGVAPAWDTWNGWAFDGLDDYLDAGLVPGSNWSIFLRYSAVSNATDRDILGVHDGTYNTFKFSHSTAVTDRIAMRKGSHITAPPATGGALALARNIQGDDVAYVDGVFYGNLSFNDIVTAKTIYIGGANGGTRANVVIQAVAFYDEPLTDAQIVAISQAMMAIPPPPAPTATATATIAPTATPSPTPTATPPPLPGDSIGLLSTAPQANVNPFSFTVLPVPTADPTAVAALSLDWGVTEMNYIGSITLTVLKFLDRFAFIYRFIILLLALLAVRWLYGFVTGSPGRGGTIRAGRAIDTYYDFDERSLRDAGLPDDVFSDALEDSRYRRRRAKKIISPGRR